jgi:hypothetical protein
MRTHQRQAIPLRRSPYFSDWRETRTSAMVLALRKHVVLWESELVNRFYPALFVIRTPTADRKLND